MTSKPLITTDILILGAGIGGLETYRELAKRLRSAGLKKTITLLDQNNFFTFVPMLHEVISGSIEPGHCTIPLQKIIHPPHQFFKAAVKKIDPAQSTVTTSAGTFNYTTLVVALGSGVNYFGVAGGVEHSYNVRSLGGALSVRHRLVELLESPQMSLQAVLVGGGSTGVEVAGQLAEFASKYVHRHYPAKKFTLTLLESSPAILAQFPPLIQTRVTKRLTSMNVLIETNKRVTKINGGDLHLADGAIIPSDLTIWTAGIQNIAPNFLDESFCVQGRLAVNEFLQLPQFPNLYAVGDIALFSNPGATHPVPQLGETAHRMGIYVARHIAAELKKNKSLPPFRFKSLGILMPVGDWWAVVAIGNFIFFGRFAWWLRRTVYVMFMPGFLYKLKIILDWTLHIFGNRDIITLERSNINLKKS